MIGVSRCRCWLQVRPPALRGGGPGRRVGPAGERILAGRERVLGPDDPAALGSGDDLAAACTALGWRLPRTGAGRNAAHGARPPDVGQVMRHRRLKRSR